MLEMEVRSRMILFTDEMPLANSNPKQGKKPIAVRLDNVKPRTKQAQHGKIFNAIKLLDYTLLSNVGYGV